jgi:hypothetical protein
MRKRRQINAEPASERLRSSVAVATEPVRAAAHTVEERVWRGSDWARDQADRGAEWARDAGQRAREAGGKAHVHSEAWRWPFERVAWLVERWIVWPIQERTSISISRQALTAGGLGILAIAVIAFSVVVLGGNRSTPKHVVAAAPASAPAPVVPTATAEAPAEPVLRGAAPSFDLASGVGVADSGEGEAGTIASGTSALGDAFEDESGATTSSEDPVPAGPAAMKTARRFADAFVSYEVGEKPQRTAAIFEETTSPRLATALQERPPRQPAGVDVPQARVLNLVPGPRNGSAHTVSVSLLRLGATSELRLEIEKIGDAWVVTDVRG